MFQSAAYAVKSVPSNVSIYVYDGAGSPITGLAYTDVRAALLKSDGSAFNGKTLSSTTWTEVGDGLYLISLGSDDYDTAGALVLKLTPSPSYVGTMRQSTKIVWIADESGLDGGLILDRPAWVPLLLTLSDVPVGGLTEADVTQLRYLEPGAVATTTVTLSSANFREILDTGDPTGVYQVLLPYTVFNEVGTLQIDATGLGFDAFMEFYPVAKANTRRTIITVRDGDTPLAGATVYASSLSTGLVEAQADTDALGQVAFDLQDGEYRITLQQGSAIFMENNVLIEIKDPDETPEDSTAAEVETGNEGPFTLTAGDTLSLIVNDGEEQTITFNSEDFVAGATILSFSAEYLAGLIRDKAHSLAADTSGLNYTKTRLTSILQGPASSIQVTGGTANDVLNFPTDRKAGTALRRVVNGVTLNGESFVPAFNAPDADTVEVTLRIVDLEGRPVENVEVILANKFSPPMRSPGGDAILGRQEKIFYTDRDGVLQKKNESGKPRLLIGARFDVIIAGTGIVRQDLEVPATDFNLMDQVDAAEDIFTIQYPSFPRAPRS